jgi:outer membrane protein OmpA-like peptidoglycan-associated protein
MTKLTLCFAGSLLVACSASEPPELRDAHSEYARVSRGIAARLAPADLRVAKEQLSIADKAFYDNGNTNEVRDLAYAAQRKAELAEARGQTIASYRAQEAAQTELARLQDEQVRLTSAKIAAQQTPAPTSMISERAKFDAEMRAHQAAVALKRISTVKEEADRIVVTLSGVALFAPRKADVLPQAQAKLNDIADVLSKQDPDSKVIIEGYTDAQDEPATADLAQKRADAVKSSLVSHGVGADRVTAQGSGKAPESGATNRRAMIIIQR